MVKKADVDKDIDTIAEKNGVVFFSYTNIFNKNIKNKYHYDFETVINKYAKVKNISYDEAKEFLLDKKFLSYLPDGEFKINVPFNTKLGDGVTIQDKDIKIVFTFNNDPKIKYHELAHTLQNKHNLFNKHTIEQLYQNSSANLTEKQKEKKLADKNDYLHYLREMHADSFAFAALMLRAENNFDFLRQISYAYHKGLSRNFKATIKGEHPSYEGNNSKFYATLPVMKQTIKTIRNIRKSGKTKDYFDENGVIHGEKLAKLCEDIVLKSAYSPRTLGSFFHGNIFDSHNKNENGWRKHSLQSVVQGIPATLITTIKEKQFTKSIAVIKQELLAKNIRKNIKNNELFQKTTLSQVNQQAKILKTNAIHIKTRTIDDNAR